MQTITPSLWFDRNAAEAVAFYTSVFPDGTTAATQHYPTEGLPDFQRELAGDVLTIDFELAGQRFTAVNAGPEFPINPSISFMVNFDPSRDSQASDHLDALWQELSAGGRVLMPLDEYPFSPHYGWVQDRYGVSWQLILTDPEGDPRPEIIPSLLFCGPNTNLAREAVEYYTSVFAESRIATFVPYPEQTGPAAAGSAMFCDLQLAGHWFVAMDSGVEHDFTFNEGVSLLVTCSDQAEIDRLWSALSHDPEAEQCGWCRDRFGVNWQIVPENLDELMSRPGAHQTLLSMKKIEIDAF